MVCDRCLLHSHDTASASRAGSERDRRQRRVKNSVSIGARGFRLHHVRLTVQDAVLRVGKDICQGLHPVVNPGGTIATGHSQVLERTANQDDRRPLTVLIERDVSPVPETTVPISALLLLTCAPPPQAMAAFTRRSEAPASARHRSAGARPDVAVPPRLRPGLELSRRVPVRAGCRRARSGGPALAELAGTPSEACAARPGGRSRRHPGAGRQPPPGPSRRLPGGRP